MNKTIRSLIIFFLFSFIVSTLVIHAVVRMQVARQTNVYKAEIESIHSNIEDRFRLFIDAPLAIGITSAEYLGSGALNDRNYEALARKILKVFDELLGLTILDANGKIIRVYPLIDNPDTLGRISQNTQFLKDSFQVNSPYWLSPPFLLYQGPVGFSFYVPIVREGHLKGWVTPIISRDRFFNKFIRSEFLETYHLVIHDDETGSHYFATAELPKKNKNVHVHKSQIRGRKMSFLSWRKESTFTDQAHWPFSLLLSFIMSMIVTYAFWLFQQKKTTRVQLDDINGLLKITVRDTTTTLDSIKYQLNLIKQGSGPMAIEKFYQHVDEISTMVQQITVLQRLTGDEQHKHLDQASLLPLMNEAMESLKGPLFSKRMKLTYHSNEFQSAVVMANKWLLCHSILRNIGQFAIDMANPDTELIVHCNRENNFYVVTYEYFGVQKETSTDFNHGLFIAQKVVQIHQGELTFHGNTIQVKLPAV